LRWSNNAIIGEREREREERTDEVRLVADTSTLVGSTKLQ
jgi:hypothetical protein